MSELDNLAGQADVLTAENVVPADGGAPGEQPGQPEKPKLTNEQAVGMLLTVVREGLGQVLGLTTLKASLSDDNVKLCASAIAPVLDKYQVDLGGVTDMPEIAAAFVAGPILYGAFRLAMEEMKQRAAAQERQRQADQAADGQPSGQVYEHPPVTPQADHG